MNTSNRWHWKMGMPMAVMAGLAAGALLVTCWPPRLHAAVPQSAPLVANQNGRVASMQFAQNDNSGVDAEVPPDQVEKYIAVYKAMHRNRSLTAQQAAAQQGMTLKQFRDLENRIERDDAARDHVRDELQKAAKTAPHPMGVPSKDQKSK
ncbi:MAG: hypothetical protein ACREQ4_05855 [Candidatus Binataceae bacterium]